jgi:hypothetical protein
MIILLFPAFFFSVALLLGLIGHFEDVGQISRRAKGGILMLIEQSILF